MEAPHRLATAVSAITARLCGVTFVPGLPSARGEVVSGRLFVLPVHGRRRFGLLLSCDRATARELSIRLATTGTELTGSEVVEVNIRDLLARIATGLERALPTSPSQLVVGAASSEAWPAEGVPLLSEELPGLRLWIVQHAPLLSTPAFVSEIARDFR
ncbi:MAG TPA: hypothetical protein VHU40_06370 [Polyangia bacterium]|nr:hypothetical protein [Polyangia bacterium]